MDKRQVGLIAIDLDGTLLSRDKSISPDNVKTLMEAQEAGIVVCINTGRMAQDAAALAEQFGLTCAVAGSNGAYLMDAKGKKLHEIHIPGDRAVALCRLCQESGLRLIAHLDNCLAVEPKDIVYTSASRSLTMSCRRGMDELLRCAQDGMLKLVVLGERYDPRLDQLRERVHACFPELPVVSSGSNNIEIGVAGSGKDMALRQMCEMYGVPLSQAMAIGDAENDLPMLRVAGYSVAMGNATDEVKAACRFVTRSNEESGVAYAVRKWAMNEE